MKKRLQLLFATLVLTFGLGFLALSLTPSRARAAKLACEIVWNGYFYTCSSQECQEPPCCAPCISWP